VKRIWTSSYTLYSGGLILLILAGFYATMEMRGFLRWAFPLMVIGANSIAIYVMSWTMEHFVRESLEIHLGSAPFLVLGAPFEPVLQGVGVLLVFWWILHWMYKKKIFIKI
jgi:predicted acyltransferase